MAKDKYYVVYPSHGMGWALGKVGPDYVMEFSGPSGYQNFAVTASQAAELKEWLTQSLEKPDVPQP